MRLFWILFLLTLTACSPCKKLAEQICDCEKTQSGRTACKQSLSLKSQHKAFEQAEDPQRCQAALDNPNCNCDAIYSYQFEACGFTRP